MQKGIPTEVALSGCMQAGLHWEGIYSAVTSTVCWVFIQFCWTVWEKKQFHISCYLLTTCEANSTGERWQPNLLLPHKTDNTKVKKVL